MNVEQYVASLKNEVVLSQSKSNETSLAIVGRLIDLVLQSQKVIADLQTEKKRLDDLCAKNKIDASLPKPPATNTKPQEIPKPK